MVQDRMLKNIFDVKRTLKHQSIAQHLKLKINKNFLIPKEKKLLSSNSNKIGKYI